MIFKHSKQMMMAALLVAAAMMVSCKSGESDKEKGGDAAQSNNKSLSVGEVSEKGAVQNARVSLDGFEKTPSGLYYKFEKQNPSGQQVQIGDVLYGELTIKLDTLTLRTNAGKPDFFAQAVQNWEPNIYEGLLMMHTGEVATFAYEADTLVKMLGGQSIHPDYKAGTGQMLFYTIDLQRTASMEEAQKQQEAEMKKMKKEEPGKIRDYVKQLF